MEWGTANEVGSQSVLGGVQSEESRKGFSNAAGLRSTIWRASSRAVSPASSWSQQVHKEASDCRKPLRAPPQADMNQAFTSSHPNQRQQELQQFSAPGNLALKSPL